VGVGVAAGATVALIPPAVEGFTRRTAAVGGAVGVGEGATAGAAVDLKLHPVSSSQPARSRIFNIEGTIIVSSILEISPICPVRFTLVSTHQNDIMVLQ
jgi:hypothetical protein